MPIQKANIVLHRLISDEEFTPSLFDTPATDNEALNDAMDQITQRYGKKSLYLGGAHGAMDAAQPKIAFNHIPDVKLEG